MELGEEEKEQFFTVVQDYANILVADSKDLGCTSAIHHGINMGDAAPIRQHLRRVPSAVREQMRLRQDMQQQGIIHPSRSPWASPIVLVKKKDGSTRFCIDYCKVNAITRKDAYPLPRVDDTLDTLAGSKWITTINLISGY